jgi:DNA-binding response OmpR family regulator
MSTPSRGRVVVVNDDQAILELYRDMLRELRYEPVAMVTEGIETERIRDAHPDAVILDLQVGRWPEYGVQMAKELRNDRTFAAIPIIVCTADTNALGDARNTLRNLGVPVILKPFTVEELDRHLGGGPAG